MEYSKLLDKLENLTVHTNYNIIQRNGQRKYGPPTDWAGPPPPRGCEIFIGKLPRELFEDELVPVFASVGTIYELRMMLNFSGSNRGFAFLKYSTRGEAAAAISKLHNYEIRPGHRIGVVKSVDNCHLYIGGIPRNKDEDEIAEELSKHVSDIVRLILPKDLCHKNLNRGFAFVEFKTHRAAAMARRCLVPGFAQLWGRDVEVEWAELEPNKYDDKVKNTQDQFKITIPDYNDIFKSPVFRLEELCKINSWPLPKYICKKYAGAKGTELWMCYVEFVGDSMSFLPRFVSPPSLTLAEAHTNTAAACLLYILQKKEQLMQQYQEMSPIKSPWRKQTLTSTIPMKIW